jgi:hypothetical protein
MRDWEQAAVLTEVLDRHIALLSETRADDWTIYLRLGPLLSLLGTEPLLSALVADYVGEARVVDEAFDNEFAQVGEEISKALRDEPGVLGGVRPFLPPDQWQRLDFEKLHEKATDLSLLQERVRSALDLAKAWLELRRNHGNLQTTQDTALQGARLLDKLGEQLEAVRLPFERIRESHPGFAYERLHQAASLNYLRTGNPARDEDHNRGVARVHGSIRDSKAWGPSSGALPQPSILALQQDARTLHLALVTSLARGRSRLAIVRRFAARCESFDREDLAQAAGAATPGARGRPEALLTLAFARYLFDAGFNPLVDAAACGLRPDVLDATSSPAVYVEAKQFEAVAEGVVQGLRSGLQQALNTWDRLAKRWYIPEAFLLVFRRSGRPIAIEPPFIEYGHRWLYVIVVDIAVGEESGSHAKEPVRVTLSDLLPVSSS